MSPHLIFAACTRTSGNNSFNNTPISSDAQCDTQAGWNRCCQRNPVESIRYFAKQTDFQ